MRADLNFSPKPFIRRDPFHLVLVLVNVGLVCGLFVSLYYLWVLYNAQQEQMNVMGQLQERRSTLQERFDQVGFMLQDLDLRTYDREIRFYAQIQQELQIPWVTLMDDLAGELPDGVRIQYFASGSVQESRNQSPGMQIMAEARTKKDQVDFLSALRKHPAFEKVLLLSETYEGPTVLFEASFHFNSTAGGEAHD